jgi:hypothetical protein
MQAYKCRAMLPENHRLVLDLPHDIPSGSVGWGEPANPNTNNGLLGKVCWFCWFSSSGLGTRPRKLQLPEAGTLEAGALRQAQDRLPRLHSQPGGWERAQYWIINVLERRIEVHLDPNMEGARYRNTRAVAEGVLAPACFPDVGTDVGEVLE